jgi:predicted membrane-bound spermidine synthase
MLSAFILGLALGALWIRRRIDRLRNPIRTLGLVQWAMGLMALATLPIYVASFDWIASLMTTFARTDTGYVGFTAARYALCLVVMLPATFCAGMTLPIITRTLIRSGSGEQAIGRVYAWNTLGSIVGVVLAGMVLLPAIGVKAMLIAGAAVDMVIGIVLVLRSTDRRVGAGWLAVVSPRALATGLAVGTLGISLIVGGGVELEKRLLVSGVYRHGSLVEREGWDLLFYRDGRTATVSSIRVRSSGQVSLATNGKVDASLGLAWFQSCDAGTRRVPLTGDAATQALTPLVTLAHNPGATSAAVIGYGSGMTSHVMLGNPRLKEVVTIEIEPEMIEGARLFHPANRRATEDPRSTLIIDDAKSYFASEHRQFDLILSEPSNPWVSGVSGLFTSEFYGRVRDYLSEDGVFGQWIQTYELSDGLVLSVLAAIHENFRSYDIYLTSAGDLLIIASKRAQLPRPDWSVVNLPEVSKDLCHFLPLTPAALDGLRLAGRRELAPVLASFGQPNSDYYPVLDLGAERRRYLRDAARGFKALSSEWYNLTASISGARRQALADTLAALPESPRVSGGALAARLRRWQDSPRHQAVDDPDLQLAAYLTRQWRAWAEKGEAPSSWELWLDQMQQVERFWNAGRAGTADPRFYAGARGYAERFRAPAPVREVVAFRQAVAAWDFPAAAQAADRLLPVVLAEKRWIHPDELRDGMVMAKLHTGDAAGARMALDTLRRFSKRTPDDLRSRMLDAYVAAAEGRQTAASR